jgi:hypothetical protein
VNGYGVVVEVVVVEVDDVVVVDVVVVVGVTPATYSATQSTSIDTFFVGHWRPTVHRARCSRLRSIGTLGILAGLVSRLHTRPSTKNVTDVALQMTPHVCHLSMLS